jgi:predicted ArsR family transcriptional regulator
VINSLNHGKGSPVATAPSAPRTVEELEIPLERDLFLRTLIRTLAGTLDDVVGVEEASGYISLVGQSVGDWINTAYQQALQADKLDASQVASVLVDLKRRIKGDFFVIEQDGNKIVLGNRACPFGDKVIGRPSMCMMTSNVFGVIAADNLGYGRVELKETIAEGHAGCRVIVHLKPDPDSQPSHKEYFKS